MSLGLLRRQQNNTMGMVVLFLLLAMFSYGLMTGNIDWLQFSMMIFTLYAFILLTASLLIKVPQPQRNDFYRPLVSILVPAKNEEKVIGNTLLSLSRLQYFRNNRPNFEIIVINDASTDRTEQIVKQYERKFDFIKVISRQGGEPAGKAAALNAGLIHARGEVVAVFDADSHVNSDFLLKSIPLLYDEKVAGIQGRVKLYNPNENLVTRLQNDEFLIFNHLTQKGKDVLRGVPCLGGNGQLVKRDALEEVGGWNEESLTEDFDLTFRLLLHGYQVHYAEHAVLWQEAVHTWKRLFRQRIRWGEGLLTSMFDFFLPVLSAKMTLLQRLDAVFTLSRILLPFWVIESYLYQIFALLEHKHLQYTLSPLTLGIITFLFFVSMAWSIAFISPCKPLQVGIRVLKYWFYAVVWIMVLPISYTNYLKTSRTVFWDKTHHKGIELEALSSQTTTSVFT